jgi:putative ABC transport system permease protein
MDQFLTIAILVGLLYSLVTIGLGVSFRVLNYPDLTLEGALVFGATASLLVLQATGSSSLSIFSGMAAGGVAGALTATIHLVFRVSKLLSGIVTAAVLYSVNIRLLGNLSVVRHTRGATLFTRDEFTAQDQPSSILLLLGIVSAVVVLLAVLFRSRAGLLLRGLGEDERFVAAQGHSPKLYLTAGLMLANALIGLCGSLLFHFHRVVDVNMVAGTLVAALAAMMIGETACPARAVWHHISGCVVGTIVYQAFVTLVLFGLGGTLENLVIASDVRLLTGLCLIIPSLVVLRRRSHRLFASNW